MNLDEAPCRPLTLSHTLSRDFFCVLTCSQGFNLSLVENNDFSARSIGESFSPPFWRSQ